MIPKNVSCVKHPVRCALDLSRTTASAAHSQGDLSPSTLQYKDLASSSAELAVWS